MFFSYVNCELCVLCSLVSGGNRVLSSFQVILIRSCGLHVFAEFEAGVRTVETVWRYFSLCSFD